MVGTQIHLMNTRVETYFYLDLLIGSHSTENNLRKSLRGEHPEADTTNNTTIFY